MAFRRRIVNLAASAAGVAVGGTVILVGAWLGGSLGDALSSPLNLSAIAVAVVCLLLALGAIYAGFRFDPAHGRRRCRRCWTVTTGNASLRCPSCGRSVKNERSLLRTRRSLALVILGLVLLGAAHAASVYPDVRRQGLKAGVPTTALVVAWPWLPEKLWREVDGGVTSRQLYPLQRWILRQQCERAIRASNDRVLVGRAARALPDGPPPYALASARLLSGLFHEYCSDDRAVSDRASEFLYQTLTHRFIPAKLDDATAAALVEPVRRGLGSTNVTTVQRSAATAEYLGAAGRPLLPRLEELVRMQDDPAELDAAGNAAVCAIGSMAPVSDEAWLSLFSLTESPNESVQVAALQEMTRAGFKPHASQIGDRASALLESPSENVAATAATTLIYAGAEPCAAAPRILARALRSDAVAVRAVQYLAANCPSEELHSILDRMLYADDHRIRWIAIEACAALGERGTRHRDALLRLASEHATDPELAEAAVKALANIERADERSRGQQRR